MHRLINGAVYFHDHEYLENEALFRDLSEHQTPHTLFITCVDSRMVPNMVTHTKPGDLLILRNIANLVPPYERADEFPSASSAIDFAVNVLEVVNIVICGHSDCGGCKLIADHSALEKAAPMTQTWLGLAGDLHTHGDRAETEKKNVISQMKNLLSYPGVSSRHAEGKLTIKGWYYRIESGEVFQYVEGSGQFELLN